MLGLLGVLVLRVQNLFYEYKSTNPDAKVQILTQELAEGRAGKADGGEEAARTAIN